MRGNHQFATFERAYYIVLKTISLSYGPGTVARAVARAQFPKQKGGRKEICNRTKSQQGFVSPVVSSGKPKETRETKRLFRSKVRTVALRCGPRDFYCR